MICNSTIDGNKYHDTVIYIYFDIRVKLKDLQQYFEPISSNSLPHQKIESFEYHIELLLYV